MLLKFICRRHGVAEPAEEHRGVDDEVQVMRAIERVEVERALALHESSICLHRSAIRDDGRLIISTQHVDVTRHVLQVAGIGDQSAQQVSGANGCLRPVGHLE